MDSPNVEDVARLLAREHASDDPNTMGVYWAPHASQVRLVEVSFSVPDITDGEVSAFWFTPDPPDVPYESSLVLLSPADWERRKELDWPCGFEDLKLVFARGEVPTLRPQK
jgi:hypothetical protein